MGKCEFFVLVVCAIVSFLLGLESGKMGLILEILFLLLIGLVFCFKKAEARRRLQSSPRRDQDQDGSISLSNNTLGREIELNDIHRTRTQSQRSSSLPREPIQSLPENVNDGIQSSTPIIGHESSESLSDNISGREIEPNDIHRTQALSPRSSSLPIESLPENVNEGIQSSTPITGQESSGSLSDNISGREIEPNDIHTTRAISPRRSSLPIESLPEIVTEVMQSSIPIAGPGEESSDPVLPDHDYEHQERGFGDSSPSILGALAVMLVLYGLMFRYRMQRRNHRLP